MNKKFMYKNVTRLFTVCTFSAGILLGFLSFSQKKENRKPSSGTLKISFTNTANGKPVVLRDSMYSNFFGEQYSISKLKYYISNILLDGKNLGGYYLMNAATGENSFEVEVDPGTYNHFGFLLGVDSIRNCSGAQSGALDPMNDMFWTWNSGYVMLKLEGSSPASTFDLNRIEHHIGGYKAGKNVATKINFDFTNNNPIQVKANTVTEVMIETNLDDYWHGSNDIRIAELPVCTTAGDLAKKVAANFPGLFSVKNISQH